MATINIEKQGRVNQRKADNAKQLGDMLKAADKEQMQVWKDLYTVK